MNRDFISKLDGPQKAAFCGTLLSLLAGLFAVFDSGNHYSLAIFIMTTTATFAIDRANEYVYQNNNNREIRRLVARDRDLQFVGDYAAGLYWFKQNCQGASHVINTIFHRSDKDTFGKRAGPIEDFNDLAASLMKKGCIWTNVYRSTEREIVDGLRQRLKPAQLENFKTVEIDTAVPLTEYLIVQYENSDRNCVLVGWGFVGSHDTHVFKSQEPSIVRYYRDYHSQLLRFATQAAPLAAGQVAQRIASPAP